MGPKWGSEGTERGWEGLKIGGKNGLKLGANGLKIEGKKGPKFGGKKLKIGEKKRDQNWGGREKGTKIGDKKKRSKLGQNWTKMGPKFRANNDQSLGQKGSKLGTKRGKKAQNWG